MKMVKFLIGMCLCTSVNAQEYVEIVDPGATYSSVYFLEGKGQKYLSSDRKNELSNKTNDFYHSTVGHIGKFVYTFDVDSYKRTVLDISGNYIVVSSDAYKPSTRNKFESFQNEVKIPKEFFGLKLGADKYQDVISKLKASNIKYEKRWFTGSSKRPILYVYGDSKVPEINGITARDHRLQFINDTLYSIEFWWKPQSDRQLDKNKYSDAKIYDGLITGLKDKYLKDQAKHNKYSIGSDLIEFDKGRYHRLDHLWVNDFQHITVETWTGYPQVKLTYNATELFKNATELNEQLNVESKKKTQEEKAEKNSSSL
ncbi:conserved exported hypothetical protein [Vibrio crassostreae]|uniref:hypothetical protein n=1 Tax=Vibrio crassostreae TaxID=246167 RepID=UPI00104B3C9D|nr:hypothetical protein [Vibrio crassostreae]TCN81443.1 hypothetical protein EDB37_102715 [Vibrio crassostreae]CAK2470642.1 conserved exported hypothetical protein [Vibrio crassostreae]CAK3878247.1 conserved exported hypothetical protein [Vibrio crassostreae]